MKRYETSGRATAGGFTLVELLVVMGIIGLLVGLLIPGINFAITASRMAATANTIRGLSAGLYNFKRDWSVFPPSSRKAGRVGADSAYNWKQGEGFKSVALYMLGPQGNGWGAGNNKRSPFDAIAINQFGPYYEAEKGADITVFRDNFPVTGGTVVTGLGAAGCILYYRFEPGANVTSTVANYLGLVGVLDYQDNPVDPDPLQGFSNETQFVWSVAVPQGPKVGTSQAPARWRSEDFVLISSGPDRAFGYVKIGTDGKLIAATDIKDPEAACDDVTSFGH